MSAKTGGRAASAPTPRSASIGSSVAATIAATTIACSMNRNAKVNAATPAPPSDSFTNTTPMRV